MQVTKTQKILVKKIMNQLKPIQRQTNLIIQNDCTICLCMNLAQGIIIIFAWAKIATILITRQKAFELSATNGNVHLVHEWNLPTRVPAYWEASITMYDYFAWVQKVTHWWYTPSIDALYVLLIASEFKQSQFKIEIQIFSKSILNRLVANHINKSVMGSGITFFMAN
jgi:hypothetical protein